MNNKLTQYNRPQKGIFWVVEVELLAFPYDDNSNIGISKYGENYNHKLLWEHVKPKGCNKSFDYYPRGRVEINKRGKVTIYMNKNIGEDSIASIMNAFGLSEAKIHYDGSEHYKCYLDHQ